MKRLILIIQSLVCFACYTAYGQDDQFIANGKVLDSATGLPLSGASVFCQNTTLGTITNAEGNFSIKLPKGGYDMIVSYTGYDTYEARINSTNAADMVIALKTKDRSLSEVTVAGSTEVVDGLAKYGEFFLSEFVGVTPNATFCTVLNPEVLQFFFSKKRNRLKVKAKEDLIIVNNALGYKIKYQLDSFAYEYGSDISTYSGYPFFEEMQGTEEQKIQWTTNRSIAYNGSRLHFMRAWHDSTLANEGFVIESVLSTKPLKTEALENPYDSSFYAGVENSEVEISHTGKLRIVYNKEMPDKKYLSQYKLPAYLRAQITIMDIADTFVIEQNGYFYEQADIINTGYWSWEKIAEQVPSDYQPK